MEKHGNPDRLGVVCFFAALFLFCSREYNPFTDPGNVNSYVSGWSFSSADSVSIFETVTFKVSLAVREEIDSIVLLAPINRFWKDTVIKTTSPDISLEPVYTFSVSFFDTGIVTVVVKTFRSNGEELLHPTLSVRVYNPLRPGNLNAFLGDSVFLLTPGVPDQNNVRYHWKLEDGESVISLSNNATVVVVRSIPLQGHGSVWVSDSTGTIRSRDVPFSYSFRDNSKPEIRCVNEGLVDDTIRTADRRFAFRVHISDAGCGEVDSCGINGAAFDFVNPVTRVYTRLFSDMAALTPNGKPFRVTVFARDSKSFGNTQEDTFYIAFDTALATSAEAVVSFELPERDIVTKQRMLSVAGVVSNNSSDTLAVICSNNGSVISPAVMVADTGWWRWTVPLELGVNDIVVGAYGADSTLRAKAVRRIVVDTSVLDTVAPVLLEVLADGRRIGGMFSTEATQVNLAVLPFDEGSGIDRVIINNDSVSAVRGDSGYWYSLPISLVHDKNGNAINIVVIDSSNNRCQRLLYLYSNRLPELGGIVGIRNPVCAHESYSGLLSYSDPDGDEKTVEIIKAPRGLTLSETLIDWVPEYRPGLSKDTLILSITDNFNGKTTRLFEFDVSLCSLATANVRFTTSEQNFPAVLQVGTPLVMHLEVNSAADSLNLLYKAVRLDTKATIFENATGEVRWLASPSDTGFRKFMILVGDGDVWADTLLPVIHVVPKNQYPCSLSVAFSGIFTAARQLDLFTRAQPETLTFQIHDNDDPLTEAYAISVTLGAVRSEQVLTRKSFSVVVRPDVSKKSDTLTVSVIDSTWLADSTVSPATAIRLVIRYADPGPNNPPQIAEPPVFPGYFCVDSSYSFTFKVTDLENDSTGLISIRIPGGMAIDPSGTITWKPAVAAAGDDTVIIRVCDKLDTSEVYRWPVFVADCGNLPAAVKFTTTETIFPLLMQAEVESLIVQLQVAADAEVLPLRFKAVTDNGTTALSVSSAGLLKWFPGASDTGARTMTIIVTDRYNRSDSLLPAIRVIPRNQFRCRLIHTYSGPTLPSGIYTMFSTTQPESAQFVIQDDDYPSTERYIVKITPRKGTAATTLTLGGDQRAFTVKVSGPTGPGAASVIADTITVTVKDSTGYSDTTKLFIRFPINALTAIKQPLLSLDASSNVTMAVGIGSTRVSGWADPANVMGSNCTQMDYYYQPTLVSNAVNKLPAILFDHSTSSDANGLFNTSFRQWADTPFTVFIVFSPRTLTTSRQNLISTNTAEGFGIGITCNQTIGIFNNLTTSNGCAEASSSNLTVEAKSWYVASFRSGLGITANGTVLVSAWLNGDTAAEALSMSTQSEAGLAIGTGTNGSSWGWGGTTSGYEGSLDGWIAAVAIFQRALTEDERYLIERYLGKRYGIAIR